MLGAQNCTDAPVVPGLEARAAVKAAAAQRLRQVLRGYGTALATVLVTFAIALWLDPFQEGLLSLFFLVPVVITAAVVGLGPSLFATGLSLPLILWFFVEPRHSLGISDVAGWFALGAYLVSSLGICWFAEKLRRTKSGAVRQIASGEAQQQVLMTELEARKAAAEALSASERQYRAMVETIANLVWTASPDGSCDFASGQWERYTGVPAAECQGDGWKKSIHPEDCERVLTTWTHAVKSGHEVEFDVRLRGRDGTFRWFKTRAVPLRDDAGHVSKWFVTSTDVNALVQAEQALCSTQEGLENRIMLAEMERLKNQLQQETSYLREKVRVSTGHYRIIGKSQQIQLMLAQAEQVAKTDATVLLLGETGTGKELLAESIHEMSPRRARPLVSVNCAAMPDTLVESELFGREKGAFTGSLSRQVGRFELADQATIFLDEVAELSLEVQAKLLRVLEAGQIERLGNPKPIAVDVRIIAATNRNLEKTVGEEKFRQDLYYRLNVFPITVPPLRNRSEDIPLLVWAFVDDFAKKFNRNIESIDSRSMDALQRHAWPGNVRELRNLIERAMIVSTGPKLQIPLPPAAVVFASTSCRKLEEVEREHILSVLESCGWRVRGSNGAAAKLGLKPTTLDARMARLGIRRPGATEHQL